MTISIDTSAFLLIITKIQSQCKNNFTHYVNVISLMTQNVKHMSSFLRRGY